MNAATRVIDGQEFTFEKVIRKHGKVKSYLFRSKNGTPAYLPTLEEQHTQPPFQSFMYKPPIQSLIALFFFFIRR